MAKIGRTTEKVGSKILKLENASYASPRFQDPLLDELLQRMARFERLEEVRRRPLGRGGQQSLLADLCQDLRADVDSHQGLLRALQVRCAVLFVAKN